MHRQRSVVALAAALTLAVPAIASAAPNKRVCPGPASPGSAECHSRVLTNARGVAAASASPDPSHFGPTGLQGAYNLTSASTANGAGRTVAIVDAYDHPYAASDVATYRRTYGLPAVTTCSLATGHVSSSTPCFAKVNQSGTTSSYPRTNGGWAQEISLDIDMASAICPNCNILLVEANSSSFSDLAAAEDTAARLGASAISNSYGGNEFSGEQTATYDGHFNHPGIPITVSSGDSGYGVEFPAASEYVTAVGGTHLTWDGTTRSETAWSGAGSGCSAYIAQPSWQASAGTGCSKRAVADVSAVADPNTGVNVYDSFKYQGQSGWMVFGGTSVASPIVASVYALAGNGAAPSYPYANATSLFDISTGSNGSCPSATPQWCTAGAGWDGPTGLGTPNGIGAF